MTAMRMVRLVSFLLLAGTGPISRCGPARAEVAVREGAGTVTIENALVRVDYDLSAGTYRAVDKRDGSVCLSGAHLRANRLVSNRPGWRHTWKSRRIRDALGAGEALTVTSCAPDQPALLLEISLHEGSGPIVLAAGLENTTGRAIRLRRIEPLAGAIAFQGLDLSENFSMLDGNGGGEETRVVHGGSVRCRNNLLVTFGPAGRTRSLVIGGLTYHDFEKFAKAGESLTRRAALRKPGGAGSRLLGYLNLPEDMEDGGEGRPRIAVVQGKPYAWRDAAGRASPEFGAILFHEKEVILEATGLDPGKAYRLGFSWWDFDGNGRVQSVSVDAGPGTPRRLVLENKALPAWKTRKQPPEEGVLALPRGIYRSGRLRIIFRNESAAPNAVVSEVWLEEGQGPPEPMMKPVPLSPARPPASLSVELSAVDPIGKRIDPGRRYLPEDRFYIDFVTDDPFEALQRYGRSVRAAQGIHLNVYDFPTVCLWYAEVYGRGQARNDTPGAVAEMDRIARSGFLKYARAAVRLVPDLYAADNQQGWWDDAHWRRGRSGKDRGNGQYAEPYETTAKWAAAVRERGGIPLTYFQTGFRSEDYARAFPDHMLFNEAMAPRRDASGRPRAFSPKMNAWQRNGVLWGYDYTDPGFLRHMRAVYANLRAGGVKGLMFDYPSSAWADQGGMEDAYATTASAYRTIFALAMEGLGPDCWIHERALARGSDIALGLITSQRVWGDTDRLSPAMATRCGLRWYKNRVVVHYDMDAKSLLKATPRNRDGLRALLTMCYVVSGRLLLGNSFGVMTEEHLHDLSRIFPYHAAPQSARPVDAFTARYPRIYDFKVKEGWHQLTFWNIADVETTIGVDLAGDAASGALGLDPEASYYVYDFWNDALVGCFEGDARLEQELRPGEARMMSIHEAAGRPQFISTNRHVMQGYVDLPHVEWRPETEELKGRARVVAGEPYVIVIALEGYRPRACTAAGARAEIDVVPGEHPLAKLAITCAESRAVQWTVAFERRG